MSDLTIDATDLDKLRADLDASRKRLGTEQRKAHKQVAETVAGLARAKARGGSKLEQHFAGAIAPRATQAVARLAVMGPISKKGKRLANTAFFGTKGRIGWYAAERYANSTPQFPKWVGDSWIAGRKGEGPYVINDAIADNIDRIEDLYIAAHERALANAFPGGFS